MALTKVQALLIRYCLTGPLRRFAPLLPGQPERSFARLSEDGPCSSTDRPSGRSTSTSTTR
jgi:hypothetical protein